MLVRRRGIRGRAQRQGSKKQGRINALEYSYSKDFLKDLKSVHELMKHVVGRPHLEAILAKVEDEDKREEMRKLLLPMLREA